MSNNSSDGSSMNLAHNKDSSSYVAGENMVEKSEVPLTGMKEDFKKERVSFRDKVVSGSTTKFMETAAGLDGDRLGKVSGKQGDSTRPSVTFTDEIRSIFSQPFQEAIVIKVLDKHMSYMALAHKLKGVWRLRGGFNLLNVAK
ncbi:hypothetical protein PIB30_003325 [Stylosanthes scabra]|uniref:Uncharacterized protein n=1 Tax=Stylosanthes scabra TaxID=79078 RepID=A0ABU6S2W9_9FABA|nr:hypothetical protein [Stylosanthes scabra]